MTNTDKQTLLNFKKKEQETLKKLFPDHTVNLVEDFSRWDNIIDEKKHLIELKNREFSLKEFLNPNGKYKGEPLIEADKYEACMAKAQEIGYKFIYIYYFTCGGYIMYNLSDETLQQSNMYQRVMWCPKNTFTSQKNMIQKDCLIIPKNIIDYKKNAYAKQNTK